MATYTNAFTLIFPFLALTTNLLFGESEGLQFGDEIALFKLGMRFVQLLIHPCKKNRCKDSQSISNLSLNPSLHFPVDFLKYSFKGSVNGNQRKNHQRWKRRRIKQAKILLLFAFILQKKANKRKISHSFSVFDGPKLLTSSRFLFYFHKWS